MSKTPSSSPGSANEPAYNKPTSGSESGPVDETVATGWTMDFSHFFQKYGMYAVAGIILCVVLFFGTIHASRGAPT
jgi:hypothetical protein